MRPGETKADYDARLTAEATSAWHLKNPGATAMPHVSQMIQSKYIAKGDLTQPVIVTIKALDLETFRDGEQAWLLYFLELPKGLKLNTTTIRTLEGGYGPQSEEWIGKRVKLYVDPNVTMAGERVGGIRIMLPGQRAVNLAAGQSAGPPAGARFDPMTGLPIAQPAQPAPRFDPMTGLPLAGSGQAAQQSQGALASQAPQQAPQGGAGDFDDDIPF